MATWKKVIVSGSAANLASLQVDNLTSGQVVIGGGTGNLSTTAINGTGNIVATTNATGLTHSGSFSGSFIGSGAGLSGVAASFPVTEKINLVTADKFFIQNSAGSTSEFVTYGSLLTDLAGTNLVTESSDSLTLASTITGLTSVSATSFTGSFSGSHFGPLTGTASYASQALSSSFASQAANATTASYVLQAVSASFATLSQTANTASYVVTAQTASYVLNAVSAAFATSAASATTASYVLNAVSAAFATNATSASFASNIAGGLNISASNINVTNNLSVNGTASFGYVQQVTGSAVIIGEEYIILNTQAPAARFAGLQIYDSGSNATASIVWDSQNNHFIYSNASGAAYNGGGFIAGPRNTGSLGSEAYPTQYRVVRGQGGDHIYDSNIIDNDTIVSIGINTQITGGLNVSAGITGSLLGTAATASYVLQAVSASFATNAANASTASFVTTAQTASFVATASYANNANLLDGLDSTVFATTGSNTFKANQIISGTLEVIPTGAAVAELVVTSTGVNIGNLAGDIHNVTGSLRVNGSITGSLLGTASYASQALSSSFASTAQTAVTANTASYVTSSNVVGTVLSSSYALTASFAQNGGTLNNALTFGTGLSGSASTFNGSTAVTVAISGSSALTTNNVTKWSGTGFVNCNIVDTGTQVQIGSGASSGVTVAAGGISVTGNSTFNNNLTVTGDLTVNGTASFINSTNTYIKDQFVQINSGSSTLLDSGLVSQYNAAGSGSAFYLDAGTTGPYGRWAVAYDVLGTSTAVTPDEYVVTAKINQASNPTTTAPTWGSGSNGSGNMWVTNAGDIFIYA
jgi:hypothetical protein